MNVIEFDASPRSAAWRFGGTFLAMGAAFVAIGWWEGWSAGAVVGLSAPCVAVGLVFASLRVRFSVDPDRQRIVRTVRVLGIAGRRDIPWREFTGIRVGRRVIPMGRHGEAHYPVELCGPNPPIELYVAPDRAQAERRARELAAVFRVSVV